MVLFKIWKSQTFDKSLAFWLADFFLEILKINKSFV